MKRIALQVFLPGTAEMALTPYYHVLRKVVVDWNIRRQAEKKKLVLTCVTVGSTDLPLHRDDKDQRIKMVAEVRAKIGTDHDDLYVSPEAARDELTVLADAFDAELAKESLASGLKGEISVDLCVWPRNPDGTLDAMKTAA